VLHAQQRVMNTPELLEAIRELCVHPVGRMVPE
jgi:hypothetical protein